MILMFDAFVVVALFSLLFLAFMFFWFNLLDQLTHQSEPWYIRWRRK